MLLSYLLAACCLLHCRYGLIAEWCCSCVELKSAAVGKAARLLLYWQDTASRLVIP